jgi:hypothetical protein
MALDPRNTVLLLGTLVLTPAIIACSGDVETTSSSTSGGSTSSSSSSSSSGGTGVCPENTICLDVKLVQEPVGAGRLAVVWFQLSDDGPDPIPLVAYDAPFDPAVQRVEIPLASITIPNEVNLLCPRACVDESMCPCTGEPKLGTGFVVVGNDADGNGKLDPGEILSDASGPKGIAFMGLGYSATPYTTVPSPYDSLFPEGVDVGVRPYRIIEGNMTFDKLGKTKDGDVFDLNVCGDPANATCSLPFPNLT